MTELFSDSAEILAEKKKSSRLKSYLVKPNKRTEQTQTDVDVPSRRSGSWGFDGCQDIASDAMNLDSIN